MVAVARQDHDALLALIGAGRDLVLDGCDKVRS